jgi:hypothetical protein
MAAITRRSAAKPVSRIATLATKDALTGSVDGTQAIDVSGSTRVIISQFNDGTAGTVGIDVIEISHDGGKTWAIDDTLLAVDSNDATGTVVVGAALNAAGVEPLTFAAGTFKSGPYHGPTLMRCARGGAGAGGTAWTTGAPSVTAVVIGQVTGSVATLA